MPADVAKIRSYLPLNVPIIEDCAQALGGYYSCSNVPLGVWSEYACYSFQAVKTVTTGDGGMLICPRNQVERAKLKRWFGIDRAAKMEDRWQNDITELGYKYQMTDIAAAMGIEGLKTLDRQIEHRKILRGAYRCGLVNVDGIRLLDDDPQSACWLTTILVERREEFRKALKAHAIESNQVHFRNDRYDLFQKSRVKQSWWKRLFRRQEFPNMDAIDGKYLCLPMHMGMSVEDVERICEVVRKGW
jgi:perosamine synthetase